jgi:HK97 family phage prohead protease
MPTPHQGEDRSDFIARCVPELVDDEGVPQRQAVARCFSIWNDRNKAGGHTMNRATQKVRFEDLPAPKREKRADLAGLDGVEFKALKLDEVKVDRKKRRVEGWAAAYGNVDLGGDRIHPGAAQKTIEDRMPRQLIKFFWNHEFGIGMPETLEEHSTGLLAVAKVTEHPEFDKYLAQIEQGVAAHQSIGYSVVKATFTEEDDDLIREIKEYKLFEFGPVYWPMNELAEITGVKALHALRGLDSLADSLRDLQLAHSLLETGGLSSSHERDVKSLLSDIQCASGEMLTALDKGQPDPEAGTTVGTEPADATPDKQDAEPREQGERIVQALEQLSATIARATPGAT